MLLCALVVSAGAAFAAEERYVLKSGKVYRVNAGQETLLEDTEPGRSNTDKGLYSWILVDPDLSEGINVISALRMAQTLERQGDLARHVAAIARGRYPEPPLPEPVLGLILQMADHAVRAAQNVAQLVATQDLELASRIQTNDTALDELHRASFQMILDPANELTRQQVVDAVLMGRFLERFGDHATSVARRVGYLVSGATLPHTHDDEDADALH